MRKTSRYTTESIQNKKKLLALVLCDVGIYVFFLEWVDHSFSGHSPIGWFARCAANSPHCLRRQQKTINNKNIAWCDVMCFPTLSFFLHSRTCYAAVVEISVFTHIYLNQDKNHNKYRDNIKMRSSTQQKLLIECK